MTINRFIRKSAVLAKNETTYKTDAAPTGLANAMLVSNVSVNPYNAQNVDRALLRDYFGASEQLVGVANLTVGFDVEIAGSGVAGTAPAWGPLLRACGAAETVTAGNRVEYNPITDNPESATIYWYDAGVVHKLIGARGTVQFKLDLAGKPVMSYSFTGLYGGLSAAAVVSTTLTGFQKPLVVTDANTGDITLGCTYATGAISSGTAYPSAGLNMDVGNAVVHTALLGDESIDITGRETTGAVQLALTAAQEVTFLATVQGNGTQSLGLVHGTTAGNTAVFYAPAVQLTNYSKQDRNGRRMIGYDLRFLPVAGNDEWLLAVK